MFDGTLYILTFYVAHPRKTMFYIELHPRTRKWDVAVLHWMLKGKSNVR